MKKMILSLGAACLISAAASADENLRTHTLVRMPHPLPVMMANAEAFAFSDSQMKALNVLMEHMPASMHALLEKARDDEQAIRRAVMHDGKSKVEVAAALDALGKLKRQITDRHIDALNRLKAILTDAQYAKLIAMLHEQRRQTGMQAPRRAKQAGEA